MASWAPHKVNPAVSGYLRNCAGATCKDEGVVCVEYGYQVAVDGAADMDVKETKRLDEAAIEEDAIDLMMALTQLHPDHANWLDRSFAWAAKEDKDWVREQIVDDPASHQSPINHFTLRQSIYRSDPWSERTNSDQRRAWSALEAGCLRVAA